MICLQRRLASVIDTTANLIAQLRELNQLRERVRKAQLSARRPRRIDNRKRTRAVNRTGGNYAAAQAAQDRSTSVAPFKR
jgi:hypothetical protein